MSQHPLKIDWNRFDGYSFQDMCNDLLVAKNINTIPLQSGPYKNKGRDAFYFEGKLNDICGKIVFQHKYHNLKPGNKNFNSLKADIKGKPNKKGEIQKAEELGAEHLIIMTNVQLGASQIDRLLDLDKRSKLKLHIWDERKIISFLVNYPYVRYFHVNGPEFPMFVPNHHYFKRMLSEDPKYLLTHAINIQGRDTHLEACQEFIKSDSLVLPIYFYMSVGIENLAPLPCIQYFSV